MTSNQPAGAASTACAVVLVCWNNRDYLGPCLRSLFGANLRHPFEVVVVDNGSTDGSQAMLREDFPSVLLIENGSNVGLGRASNQGTEATSAPYVLLLNNDTLVKGESLDRLIDHLAATPDAGAVGGTLLNGDGSFQSGWGRFPTLAEEFLIATRLGEWLWAGYPSHRSERPGRDAGWLSSACLLLRRSALEQVGLLDEDYFIYGDETDLQFRLVKGGWRVCYLPDVTTVHFGGRSMDRWKRRRMVYRGKMLFFRKNYGRAREWALRGMLGTLTVAKVVAWALAWPVPSIRDRARRELSSNAEVLRLCAHLQ
jgi:N-acetylglucosaminyl-diphospho-decaprenol L-rhamnosyltransferase